MGDEDEWCELIYSEALRLHKTSRYKAIDKLRFFALILELFVEMRNDEVTIQIKTVNIKFKLRSKNYIFWVFEIPDYQDKRLFMTYMYRQLSKF